MKRALQIGLAAFLSAYLTSPIEAGAVESTAAAIEGLSSRKERGVVSVVADPALADGRLILKVVAFNKTDQAAGFGDENSVKVFTAAGKPVAVIPLDKLIAETQGEGTQRGSRQHDPANYSGRAISHDDAGRPNVAGYTGGGGISGGISPYTDTPVSVRQDNPAAQAQVEALKAAILQPKTIAPSTAAGGQIVTEKLRFSRKEDRALRVVVAFNGEEHEFNFEPPAK
jgi:hypothetical protein